MTGEEWKAVPGYEGIYEASTLGRVRSLDRVIHKLNRWGSVSPMKLHGRVLAGGPHVGGYESMHLYRDGVQWATVTHIVIALTFIGPCPIGQETMHANGNKYDNRLENLSYGTHKENEDAKDVHGTRPKGEQSTSAKLRVTDVLEIRRRVGEPQQELADEFGCTFSNISAIQLRKSWRHV